MKKNRSKRGLCLIFSLCLLLAVFALDGGNGSASAGSRPLWILMDFHQEDRKYFAADILDSFLLELEFVTGLGREDVNVEFLPEDETERDVRLTSLRTEMMAGGGPDVFLLSCNLPEGKSWKAYWDSLTVTPTNQSKEIYAHKKRLFLDPQKLMARGQLLKLDPYLKDAQYFDERLMHPTVLEAGRYEGSQYIIPITYTFSTAVYDQAPKSTRRQAEEYAFGAAAWNSFSNLFGKLADYKTEKLLFTEQELLETVQRALAVQPEREPPNVHRRQGFQLKEAAGLRAIDLITARDLQYWLPNRYCYWFTPREKKDFNIWRDDELLTEKAIPPQDIAPIKNREGGVTGAITTYVCINRNTRRPQEAFQFVDFLFDHHVLSCTARTEEDWEGQMLYWVYVEGIPTRMDLMKDYYYSFGMSYVSQLVGDLKMIGSPQVFQIYDNLRNQVTTARFYGTLDDELQSMYNACREAKSQEELEKLVEEAYQQMTIMLGE